MKITKDRAYHPFLQSTTMGGNQVLPDPNDPDPDPDPLPDIANSSEATVPITPAGALALVQSAMGTSTVASSTVTAVFPTAPVPGHLLIAVVSHIGTIRATAAISGWDLIDVVQSNVTVSGGAGSIYLFARIAQEGDSPTVQGINFGNQKRMAIVEFEGSSGVLIDELALSYQAAATSFTLGDVTVTDDALLIAAVVQHQSAAGHGALTEDAAYTLVDTAEYAEPAYNVAYRIVSTPDDYDATVTSAVSREWGGILAAFGGPGGEPVWVGADPVVDGDDATYSESSEPTGLRLDLGASQKVASVRLLIGITGSGSRTYQLWGANAADYSDAVLVTSKTFTATGSFTPDEVLWTVPSTNAYRYWEFIGPEEDRRWFTVEMYGPGASTVSVAMDDLTDVDLAGLADGDVVVWDEGAGAWVPGEVSGVTGARFAIVAGWDGADVDLTTATMKDIDVIVPADGLIVAAYANGDNGSAAVDVWVDDTGSYPPTDADSITAAAQVTLTGASLSVDTTLTGWTKAFSAGDVFRFHPDSVSGLTNLTVTLVYERT